MLCEVVPLNRGTGARPTLRACSAQDRRITGLNGVRWWPAISKKATLTHDLFDGDFTGDIKTGKAGLTLELAALKRLDAAAAGYAYAKAAITLYAADAATAWPWPVVFRGIVDQFNIRDEKLSLDCVVNTAPFEAPAMTLTYAGTGGIEGSADLKNKIKPWCFGQAKNIEPVLFDVPNSVFQVSAYGAINAITAVYERAASFGGSVGDFANYAALVAAAIPAGRWGTCLAAGLFRLGAPPQGIITADVQGDKPGGTWIRRPGAIISRILSNAGVSGGSINAASLTALDSWASSLTAGGNINIYLTEQTRIIDLVQRIARPCNAAAGVSWIGELFVSRLGAIASPSITLNAQGKQKPAVFQCEELPVNVPFWRIEMGADRCWREMSNNEIAFTAAIIDLGAYAGATTYREGNIVDNQGARWLYVNPVATSGDAPPTLPTSSNSYWTLISGQTNFADIGGAGAGRPEEFATNGDNQIYNSTLRTDTAGWSVPAGVTRVAGLGTDPGSYFQFAPGALRSVYPNGGPATLSPLNGAKKVFVSAWGFRLSPSTGPMGIRVTFHRADGASIGDALVSLSPTTSNVWQRVSGDVDVTAAAGIGAVSYRVELEVNVAAAVVNLSSARAATTQAAADETALQPIVSRLSPATGQAESNFTLSTGAAPAQISVTGSSRDGDVVTFSPALSGIPEITFLPGGNTGAAGQNLRIVAEGKSASGFTLRAKSQSVTPGSTVTDTAVSSGGGANPDLMINRTNGSAPFDGIYTFSVTVTVGEIAPGEPGNIRVGLFVKRSGSWVQVDTIMRSFDGTSIRGIAAGAVDFGAGDEFGVSVLSATGTGTAITSFDSVVYTPGTVTETSLTPAGASAIPWIAIL